jgi:hypothetical protein
MGFSHRLQEAMYDRRGRVRPRDVKYIHFTDEKGALGIMKTKRLAKSGFINGVFAIAVGGEYVPGVLPGPSLGRAKHRQVALVFTTNELPDSVSPEEVVWAKRNIKLRTVKMISVAKAKRLLDGSLVKAEKDGWKILDLPKHPSVPNPNWDDEFTRIRQ